ncbi:MAG: hypothetical protein KDJ65_03625 [Anaerolineae bacterium]|nr:hypothetical protein [Anaerolineae bacterium]
MSDKHYFEVTTPVDPPLKGGITAQILEGGKPTNYIIRADKDWSVNVEWYLEGALTDCICGTWCLHLFMESVGPGPEVAFPYGEIRVPLDPCGDGHYQYEIEVKGGFIKPEHCTTPYKLVAALTYRTPCDKPGPMAGFCELPLVQFYESDKQGT